MGNVVGWGISRGGNCRREGDVQRWKLSLGGRCPGVEIVVVWEMSRGGNCPRSAQKKGLVINKFIFCTYECTGLTYCPYLNLEIIKF